MLGSQLQLITFPDAPAGITFKRLCSVDGGTSFALDSDNYLWSSGKNYNGVLGVGAGYNATVCCWKKVCCNYQYNDFVVNNGSVIGIRTDGTAVGWGVNNCGVLGDGTSTDRYQPVLMCCNYTYCTIKLGVLYTSSAVGLRTDGTAVSWGSGNNGALGDGNCVARCQPVLVCCNYCYSNISMSLATVVGLRTDGCAISWGSNDRQALGGCAGQYCFVVYTPIPVCCNCTYQKIVATCMGFIGILTNGQAVSWGNTTAGLLGIGTSDSNDSPFPVPVCCNYCYSDIRVSKKTLGSVIGIKADCTAVAWGCNNTGQLGDGSTTDRCQPVCVCCNYTYQKICGFVGQTIGIKTDGTAVSWGANLCGALGDGTVDNRSQPVAVCCDYAYCDITIADNSSIGILTVGTAVSWGCNAGGQLANGTATAICQPLATCPIA
jgi:alpha-tubulin suppressor-like RCC1 family protein